MRGMRPSWTACWVSEKAPVMTAWLAMMVAMVASRMKGNEDRLRHHQEERVFQRLGARKHQRPLAEVVQRQGWEHQHQPGELDRSPAEVAHVGVKRFGRR